MPINAEEMLPDITINISMDFNHFFTTDDSNDNTGFEHFITLVIFWSSFKQPIN